MGRGVGIGASLSFGLGVFSKVDEVAICRWNDFVADREVKDRIRDVGTVILDSVVFVSKETVPRCFLEVVDLKSGRRPNL